jgi:glycosyltransferase involved in cell wall biosynthesis
MDTQQIINAPKVSVIVPFYKVEKYIEKCASSLLQQTLDDMEFIFVDDCGEDNSANILKKVIEQYPNRDVKVVKMKRNSGVSAARACGIEMAQGEYIGFCDSDDWMESDMYRTLYNEAIKVHADIVGCGFVEHKEGRETSIMFDEEVDNEEKVFSFNHFGSVYGALWNKIVRRDFFIQHNEHLGDGLSMWEDSLTLIPMRLKANMTVFLSPCLYHYNVNENSNTIKFSMKKVDDSIEATKRLEKYFLQEGYHTESARLINFLKINAKEVLLRFPTQENLQMWRDTFPESRSTIWKYPQWNMLLKLRAYLVSVLPFDLALMVLRWMRK